MKTILQNTKSDTNRINILLKLATSNPNGTAENLKYNDSAKFLAEKINWSAGIFKANNQLGNFYFAHENDYVTAAKFYQANITIAHNDKNTADEALSLEQAAICYNNIGQHKTAIEYFDKALTLKPDADMEMGILGNIGYTYGLIGDYPHALSSYITSLKLLENTLSAKKTIEFEDACQKATLLSNIGSIYISMGQPDKAFENYNQVLSIGRSINNKLLVVFGLNGIGNTYKIKKDYTKAIETYLASLNECINTNSFKEQGNTLNELANVYIDAGDFDKAMDCSKAALKLAKEHNYSDELAAFYSTIGLVYLKQYQYSEAVSHLQKALAICQKTGELDVEQTTLQTLSTTYEKLNQPAKALEAYQNYIAIRDSVYNIDKANYLTRTDLQYTFDAEKQKQTAAFNEKIARQQVLTYCGYGGLALVLLLAFFMYKNYNTQKKYNALLSKEKQSHLAHISAQDTVLSDIAHTQSHFVRGPIATILGLLQFYNHEDPTDPLNKEIVEGISVSIEKLDAVVKDVVQKENKLRRDTNT